MTSGSREQTLNSWNHESLPTNVQKMMSISSQGITMFSPILRAENFLLQDSWFRFAKLGILRPWRYAQKHRFHPFSIRLEVKHYLCKILLKEKFKEFEGGSTLFFFKTAQFLIVLQLQYLRNSGTMNVPTVQKEAYLDAMFTFLRATLPKLRDQIALPGIANRSSRAIFRVFFCSVLVKCATFNQLQECTIL